MNKIHYQPILDFWTSEENKPMVYAKDFDFDQKIRAMFGYTHHVVASKKFEFLEDHALSFLAGIIVLDQFSRNMFRDTPYAFLYDEIALSFSKEAISRTYDQEVGDYEKTFFYLPFMHSEKLDEQKRCVELFQAMPEHPGLEYANRHYDIIAAYGRFPHRNTILGRESTAEELAFLQTEGSSF